MSQTTELLLRVRQIGGEQLQQLGRSLNKLGKEATDANQDFATLASQLKSVQATSANSINNLRGYANSWRQIANSVEIGTAEFKQATAEAAKLEAQLAKTEGRRAGTGRLGGIAQTVGTIAGAGVFGGPEGAIGAALGSVGGVPGAITGGAIGAQVGQLRQALGSTADYVAEVNKLKIALEGVAGSQQEYTKALQIADRATRQFNVPQEVAIQGMTRLTAAVKGAGGQVADAGLVFTNITKAIKGTGGSAEDVQGAITAMVQVFSKGKVSAEELSGQLGERLPGAVTLFAKANKMTLPELQKGLKEGQIGLNELMRFIELLGTRYGMTALKIAASSEDSGARLRVAFNDMRLAVGATLQPVGAELQNAFAKFIKDITPAVIESTKAIAAAIKFLVDNAGNISNILQFAAALGTSTLAITAASAAIKSLAGLQAIIPGVFLAMQGNAVAATTKIAALTTTVRTLASVLSKSLILTVVIVGAGVVINALNKIKEARDRVEKSKTELRGESWIKSIGGNAADYQKIRDQTQAVGDSINYLTKKIRDAKKEQETTPFKPRKEFLGLQIAADQAQLNVALLRYRAGIDALSRKKEPTTTDFAAPEGDGAGGGDGKTKKAKEIVDISIAELQIRKQIAELTGKENPLQEAFLNYRLQILKIDQQVKKGQIGIRDAEAQRLEAQDRLNEAKETERTRGVDALLEIDRLTKQQAISLEDIKVQYGLISKEQAEQLRFDREIAKLREAAKGTRLVEETEAVIAALKKGREEAKGFGNQIAVNFAAGIRSMGELTKNLGQSLANTFSGLSNVLVDFVTTGKASFADFTRAVLADLTKIFAQAALFYTLKAIIPGSSFLGKLLKFEMGGIMTSNGPMPLKRYAAGGIANSPQIAMFGEGSRPEAYVPLPDGRSIPVTMSGQGGGINVSVNVDASGTSAQGNSNQANQLGKAVGIAVQQEILKQKRPGGLLA